MANLKEIKRYNHIDSFGLIKHILSNVGKWVKFEDIKEHLSSTSDNRAKVQICDMCQNWSDIKEEFSIGSIIHCSTCGRKL